jgi:hypothetical protein
MSRGATKHNAARLLDSTRVAKALPPGRYKPRAVRELAATYLAARGHRRWICWR